MLLLSMAIPTAGEAIQIIVGGLEKDEAQLRKLLDELVASTVARSSLGGGNY